MADLIMKQSAAVLANYAKPVWCYTKKFEKLKISTEQKGIEISSRILRVITVL
jgi:hypothetical protein